MVTGRVVTMCGGNSSEPSVAVKERVNGFELDMSKPNPEQRGRSFSWFRKVSRSSNAVWTSSGGGGTKVAFASVHPPGPDPVLTNAELPRRRVSAPYVLQQLVMNFADQTNRYRELGKSQQVVVHRCYVVDYLDHILGSVGSVQANFGCY